MPDSQEILLNDPQLYVLLIIFWPAQSLDVNMLSSMYQVIHLSSMMMVFCQYLSLRHRRSCMKPFHLRDDRHLYHSWHSWRWFQNIQILNGIRLRSIPTVWGWMGYLFVCIQTHHPYGSIVSRWFERLFRSIPNKNSTLYMNLSNLNSIITKSLIIGIRSSHLPPQSLFSPTLRHWLSRSFANQTISVHTICFCE